MRDVAAAAREARERVPMRDAALRYAGERITNGGFIRCPFHNEKTPSLKLYADSYHCFGCGAHGDVTDFVGQLYGLDVGAALDKLNADYGLGFQDRRPTLQERANAQRRAWQRRREAERLQAACDAAETAYLEALDEWLRLDRNRQDHAPATPGEAWDPLFSEALRKEAAARYLVDEAEARRGEIFANIQRSVQRSIQNRAAQRSGVA